MTADQNREKIFISPHLFFYNDDKDMNVLIDGNESKSAIYFKNEELKKLLNDDEMEMIQEIRFLRNNIMSQRDEYKEKAIKEYRDAIQSWTMAYRKEDDEDKSTIQNSTNSPVNTPVTPPVKSENKDIQPKNPMTVEKGEFTSIANEFQIPADLANLFFMKLGDQLYIKVAGLQYIAGKKGYRRIEILDMYDKESQTWTAEARIYPKITKEIIESISKLSPETQKIIIDDMLKPTIGIGTANKSNVQNTRMYPFLREMAQTRALGRALRSYTGYGSTTYEELPDAELDIKD